ncbi:Hsp20/alpha crystallin family protein [Telmatospirillum sp.]|uniref:Hsp20/alpha crystallin family protein n=1 Tax=Telmatospirillum sp. TaxID=2079197 RepID=UPI00283E64A7|nr:Hsp20/alpha crystallin family protein [Telmatospirillum sp.]MDR3438895.1 Hsp20/alpha crystallin family protein [Telmatospirillum sp.]
MDVKSLVPWTRSKSAPAPRFDDDGSPFLTLHREMNRLFDDFFHGFDVPMGRFGWSSGLPELDVADTGKEIKVTAELPGMEEKDVELTLHDGVLTLKGEKKSESDGPQYSERWHGQFQRSLQLGPDVDPEKVSATFKNGLLSILIEKKPEAQKAAKRIPING